MKKQKFFRGVLALLAAATMLASPAQAQDKAVAPTVTLDELSRLVGGPTLVTLRFQNADPKAVFAELARQANVTIGTFALNLTGPEALVTALAGQADKTTGTPAPRLPPGKPLGPISIDVVRQPFWTVMRSLCTRLNVDISTSDSGGLLVQGDPPGSLTRGPISDQSLVLLVADSSSRSVKREYSLSGDRTQDRSMHLLVVVDPKLRLLGGTPDLQLNAALDEKGRKLFKAGTTPSSGQGNPFELSYRIDYDTTDGPSDSRRLADLKGTGKLFVGFNVQRWEVPDVLQAKNVARTVQRGAGTSRYVFSGLEVTDSSYIVHLTISQREFDLQGENASSANFEYRVHLYDAQGHGFDRLQNGGHMEAGADPVLLAVPFERDPPGPDNHHGLPAKLVIEIPDVRAVKVPFEFKNLPLP